MEKVISLAHGDGGELSHRLIRDLLVKEFGHQKEAMWSKAAITSISRGYVAAYLLNNIGGFPQLHIIC